MAFCQRWKPAPSLAGATHAGSKRRNKAPAAEMQSYKLGTLGFPRQELTLPTAAYTHSSAQAQPI